MIYREYSHKTTLVLSFFLGARVQALWIVFTLFFYK